MGRCYRAIFRLGAKYLERQLRLRLSYTKRIVHVCSFGGDGVGRILPSPRTVSTRSDHSGWLGDFYNGNVWQASVGRILAESSCSIWLLVVSLTGRRSGGRRYSTPNGSLETRKPPPSIHDFDDVPADVTEDGTSKLIARKKPPAFASVSSYSAWGSESATMPAPTWK